LSPHFDLDQIPKESVKRLEFIRGAGSVLYGSNAYGGVINIQTFTGLDYQKNSYNLIAGTHGAFGANLNRFAKSSDNNHFFSARIYTDDGSERDNEKAREFFRNTPNGYANLLAPGGKLIRDNPEFRARHITAYRRNAAEHPTGSLPLDGEFISLLLVNDKGIQ